MNSVENPWREQNAFVAWQQAKNQSDLEKIGPNKMPGAVQTWKPDI